MPPEPRLEENRRKRRGADSNRNALIETPNENKVFDGAGGRDWPILLNERGENRRFTEEINKSRQVSTPLHHPLFLTVFLTVFASRFQVETDVADGPDTPKWP